MADGTCRDTIAPASVLPFGHLELALYPHRAWGLRVPGGRSDVNGFFAREAVADHVTPDDLRAIADEMERLS